MGLNYLRVCCSLNAIVRRSAKNLDAIGLAQRSVMNFKVMSPRYNTAVKKQASAPISELIGLLTAIYVLSIAGLASAGLSPAVPWLLLPILTIFSMSIAVIFFWYSTQRTHLKIDFPGSASVLLLLQYIFIWPLLALGALRLLHRGSVQWEWKLIFGGLTSIFLGYATLWNVNYLLVHFVPGIHDPFLRQVDEWFYSLLTTPVSYEGLFPIVHNSFINQLLSNSYGALFGEICLVLLLVCQTGDACRVAYFVKSLFGFYAVGVVCYLIYPAIGPCLYYPDSIDATRADLSLMSGMLHDYHAARNGDPLSGYGYFIAMPSLHVMIALFLQKCLTPYKGLYRLFLPINLTLCLSTFMLGYHYVLDAVLAMVLVALWACVHKKPVFMPLVGIQDFGANLVPEYQKSST